MRLDKALTVQYPELSRKQAVELIKAGRVSVDGSVVLKPSTHIEGAISVKGDLPASLQPEAVPNPDIQLEILHEDSAIAVIEKPSGLSVHPSQHHPRDTVVNGALALWPELADPLVGENPLRPGIVHRLDKDTSGVMVLAKTQDAYASLKDQFQSRTVSKEYVALVHGHIKKSEFVIDTPIGRSTADPRKLTAKPQQMHIPKPSITDFAVQQHYVFEDQPYTLVLMRPKTGRTHQLRVHLQSIHHPIVGDIVYSSSKQQELASQIAAKALLLHASQLTFQHPESRESFTFSSEPVRFQSVLDNLTPVELA